MWARLILVALLVVCLFPTFPSASSFREKIVVLEKVMAKEINEKEALFSFVFKGERMEYVLQKNEDLDMIAYKGRDSSGYKTRLNIVYGGWERPMLRGALVIKNELYSIQPSTTVTNEYPELKKTGATVAIPQRAVEQQYAVESGFANVTVPGSRGDRVRFNPTAPSFQALTDTAQQPDPEPPLPCPVDSDPQQLFIDSVTDGGVYQNAEADLPSSTQAQIISFIEDEVKSMIDWISDVYGESQNLFLKSGTIRVELNYDTEYGAGWKTGAPGWNRDCTGDRSAWYSNTLDAFSAWAGQSDQTSTFSGGLVQLLHGCSFSGGGTVGLAWKGVTCRTQPSFFALNGVDRCAYKTSLTNFASSSSYLIATHELGHNFGLNHDEATQSIMYPSVTGFTQFSKATQAEFCADWNNNANLCAIDFGTCSCPSDWQCGNRCGMSCGTCSGSQVCENNQCITPCVPNCGSDECGADGCGGSCGSCGANEYCSSGTCVAQSGTFSDHQNLINAQRANWGNLPSFTVDQGGTSCLQEYADTVDCSTFTYDGGFACGGNSAFLVGYYSNTFRSNYEAIQLHLNSVFASGSSTYDCSTDSFPEGEGFDQSLYRRYIDRGSGRSVQYGVVRGCSFGGSDDYRVAAYFTPSSQSSPTVENCPSDGGNCQPSTCSAALSCNRHQEENGCGGIMSCPCPEGQICPSGGDGDRGCCLVDTCLEHDYTCGSVVPGCGDDSAVDCGSCGSDETCYIRGGETGGQCCTPLTCADVCGSRSAEENCGMALDCGECECTSDNDCDAGEECNEGACECPDPCEPNSCGFASNECASNIPCNSCIEDYSCDYLNVNGPQCVLSTDCCTCPEGTSWNGFECESPSAAPLNDCAGPLWTEQRGYTFGSVQVFSASGSGQCRTFSTALGDTCNSSLPLCANFFNNKGVEGSSLGDGVIVEVRDTGVNGVMGVFMHGNDFQDNAFTVSYKFWGAFLDRSNSEIAMGYYQFLRTLNGDGNPLSTVYTPGLLPGDYKTESNQWYRLFLQRPQHNFDSSFCALSFSVQPIDSDGEDNGEGFSKTLYYDCEDVEDAVGNGGTFGLIASGDAEFRNFAIVTATFVEFEIYSPTCPSQENVKKFYAALLGINSDQITGVNVECGSGSKRQAVATGPFPVSFTITSQSSSISASSLASRLEFVLSAGRGTPFNAPAGFTATPGGPLGGSGAPATVQPPASAVSTPGGGTPTTGGGGGGGLSSGAIAGIVIGSVAGAALLVAIVAGAVVMSRRDRDESGSERVAADVQVEEVKKKKRGIPVMNHFSQKRRMERGEMTSVTGRSGLTL